MHSAEVTKADWAIESSSVPEGDPWIHPDRTELSLGLTRISGHKADPETIPSADEVNANRSHKAPWHQE